MEDRGGDPLLHNLQPPAIHTHTHTHTHTHMHRHTQAHMHPWRRDTPFCCAVWTWAPFLDNPPHACTINLVVVLERLRHRGRSRCLSSAALLSLLPRWDLTRPGQVCMGSRVKHRYRFSQRLEI